MAEDKTRTGMIAHVDAGKTSMAGAIASVLAMGISASKDDPMFMTEDQAGRPDVDPINEGEGRPEGNGLPREGMRDIKGATETIIEAGTQTI